MTVHHSPKAGESVTQCCLRIPYELPTDDQLTLDADHVDCPNHRADGGLPPAMFEFIGRYAPPHPGVIPTKIRIAPDVYAALHRTAARRTSTFTDQVFGLRIDLDHSLPAGVWQVYADDDTLLRDSRSTNEVHR